MPIPVLELKYGEGEVKAEEYMKEPEWELLYEDIFDMRAWRINLDIQMLPGSSDTPLAWQVTWPHPSSQPDYLESGSVAVPQLSQKWRGGFLSCNGFDATVPVDLAQSLTYTNVWSHLGSVHH